MNIQCVEVETGTCGHGFVDVDLESTADFTETSSTAWSYVGPVPRTVTLNVSSESFTGQSELWKYLGTYERADEDGSALAAGINVPQRAHGAPIFVKKSRCLRWPFSCDNGCDLCLRRKTLYLYR